MRMIAMPRYFRMRSCGEDRDPAAAELSLCAVKASELSAIIARVGMSRSAADVAEGMVSPAIESWRHLLTDGAWERRLRRSG